MAVYKDPIVFLFYRVLNIWLCINTLLCVFSKEF